MLPWGVLAASGSGSLPAFELISTVVVSGSNANVTFSSIPQTYKHLQVRFTMRDGYNGASGILSSVLNGDFGSNYSSHFMRGNGSAVSSGANAGTGNLFASNVIMPNINDSSSLFGAGVMDILDYANTTTYKTVKLLAGDIANSSGNRVGIYSGSWRSTAAINSVMLYGANLMVVGTRVSLYGIKGA